MLEWLLSPLIKTGRLTVIEATGARRRYGDDSGPDIVIRLTDRRLPRRFLLNPRLAVGEAYVAGTLIVECGTVSEFLDLLAHNQLIALSPLLRLADAADRLARRLRQLNDELRARRNVAHHYDLSAELYDLFLDADRQYSCAYFIRPTDTLEQAQDHKKRHIASKLLLRPGLRILDIGCGWGGLALSLARAAPVDVLGVTLSTEQCAAANARAVAAGLDHRVRFEQIDYRAIDGVFDRIVSVGMFEHVGLPNYASFFAAIERLLTPDGVALVHAIGRSRGPSFTNPWLRKYIFPGGYSPALSEVLPKVEKSGLWVTDIEILRLHYALTLNEWSRRFKANRARIAALYDERFCRMWELYLAGAEIAFRRQDHMVWQMQLARRRDATPLTRDYMIDWERRTMPEAARALAG